MPGPKQTNSGWVGFMEIKQKRAIAKLLVLLASVPGKWLRPGNATAVKVQTRNATKGSI